MSDREVKDKMSTAFTIPLFTILGIALVGALASGNDAIAALTVLVLGGLTLIEW